MNEHTNQHNNERLKDTANRFQYPPTPDVAGAVRDRLESGSRPKPGFRSAWVVASLIVMVLAVLFAVPGVRAEIIRFFQVGAVRIFPAIPTQTSIPTTSLLPVTATPAIMTPQFDSVPGEPLYVVSISDLAGETNLETAQSQASFPIRLPAYPADLGMPDRVFLQEDGQMVILVWTDPSNPQNARLSLHEIGPGNTVISKFEPRVILETQVNGNYAIWAQGPYMVRLTSGSYDFRRTVEGNTLIWEEDEITYRIESNLTIQETLRIAGSID